MRLRHLAVPALLLALLVFGVCAHEPFPATDQRSTREGATQPAFVVDATPLRLVALGDAGTGRLGQRLVARAIEDLCHSRGGCAAGILLGDNVYENGLDDADDEQWHAKMEQPYQALDFPLLATLGNHDLGGPLVVRNLLPGLGLSSSRGQAQIDAAARSARVYLPDTSYALVTSAVEFISLHTTALFWADAAPVARSTGLDVEVARMRGHLRSWTQERRARWRICYGHHPYVSEGRHGDAGRYEALPSGAPGSGTVLRAFIEERVLGVCDIYLAGHDHNLQDHGEVMGTTLLVSGAGGKLTPFARDGEAVFRALQLGFIVLEVYDERIDLEFVVLDVGDDFDHLPESTVPAWSIPHRRSIAR
jgi:tartrate-resistant acid phosphatase type 5